MNKTAIKNYAIWARVQLIESAKQRAYEYEITENGENNPNLETIGGRLLSKTEKEQRQQLINQIRQKGYTQVMEEAAYTWFNRFIALRFMEVNGYLPSKVCVFTDENNAFKPEILKEAMSIELEGLDRSFVLELLDRQDNEALFRYLLIIQCNALNAGLPYMFEKIANWTELLFPANLLRQDSVIGTMISTIPEEDWTDAVQIIGWLYQYYSLEPFNQLYDGDKATEKISADELPSATQLFTPDWIVRYMVENTLGRLWQEGNVGYNNPLWTFYLEEDEQSQEIECKLKQARSEFRNIAPENIKFIDPCMGSGHILVYAFDVLMQIYTSSGWSERDAAKSIVENNLYGIDIDDRASQLAYFAVMIKGRQYDRRFLSRGIVPNVCSIHSSNGINAEHLEYLGQNMCESDRAKAINQIMSLIDEYSNAKEFGSILQIKNYDWPLLQQFISDVGAMQQLSFEEVGLEETQELLSNLLRQGIIMSKKYHVAVTNPPYLNANRMDTNLSNYANIHYKAAKQDLALIVYKAVFDHYLLNNAFISFITPTSWMFSTKFKSIREEVVRTQRIISIVDCGTELFDGKVGHLYISAWVAQKHLPLGASVYVNVSDYCYSRRDEKPSEFHNKKNRGSFIQSYFEYLPDMPLSYNISSKALSYFTKGQNLGNVGESRQGLTTSDNKRFTRFWFEVAFHGICWTCTSCNDTLTNGMKWYPFLKGGDYQKWFQRFDTVVNYALDGQEIKQSVMEKYPYLNNPGFVVKNTDWYFREGINWNDVGGERFNARIMPAGYIFADASPSYFPQNNDMWLYLAYFNSSVFQILANAICQGLHYSTGQIPKIPVITNIPDTIVSEIHSLAKECYNLVGQSVNEQEASVGFIRHPLSNGRGSIQERFGIWESECHTRFDKLLHNEERLNDIFIQIYEIDQAEIKIDPSSVSVHLPGRTESIKGLISYAVGCMLGRYSMNELGLAFTGGAWDASQYTSYMPDQDGILPITDDEYFDDDIVGMFVNWVRTVYGEEMLEANLKFIADALGGKGTPREVIRNYFLNDFYADHLKVYQKRPIYWLFSSGKKNGFKCLIYMHRYQPDLLARIRTDYVHEQQERYRTQLQMAEDALQSAAPSERVKLNKRIAKLKDQALELQKYEEKIHHLADQMIPIDLDDGVKVNYAKFQDVLEKIK